MTVIRIIVSLLPRFDSLRESMPRKRIFDLPGMTRKTHIKMNIRTEIGVKKRNKQQHRLFGGLEDLSDGRSAEIG
jgi:hypothetical protein